MDGNQPFFPRVQANLLPGTHPDRADRQREERMKTRALAVMAVLILAGLIGFVVQDHHSFSNSASSGSAPLAGRAAPAAEPSHAASGALPKTEAAQSDSAQPLSASTIPGIEPRVIKDATVALQVNRGGLQSALAEATATAGRFGGFVESASSGDKSGSVTLRIPEASFEQALVSLKSLGRVTSSTVSGKDVTSQFVDLNARLITWRSQETVLLRLMDRATSISDTLRVQAQLQQVQFRIEQIQGALRVLRNQTSYGTIDLGIREVGAPVAAATTASTPSLVRAWQQAWAGFLGVVSAVIVGLGYLVPLGLLVLAGWAVWRRVARPRPAPASAPAS
jgi:hypothetical protein